MLPIDFVEYSKKFEIGFLGLNHGDDLDIKLVRFNVEPNGVLIEGEDLRVGRVSFAFSNERYVWASENASIKGYLEKTTGDKYLLVPEMVVWTIAFEIKRQPEMIVKRWRKSQ